MNNKNELQYFREELEKVGDPSRAEGEQKYLKLTYHMYGVTVPKRRAITSLWLKRHKDVAIAEVVTLADTLWATDGHDEKSIAIELLVDRRADLALKELPLVERMVRTSTSWCYIDEISAWLVGTLYEKEPKKMAAVFLKWIEDKNFWVRRAAILGQLIPLREGRGDFELFAKLAAPHLSETEFFIRKSIGWVLRDISRKRPELTYQFVRKYGREMSGLTYREAIRHLPTYMQVKLVHHLQKY